MAPSLVIPGIALLSLIAASAGASNGTVFTPIRGDMNETACGDAPPCGTTMASYNGVAAYSNGPADQCSGNSCKGSGTYGLMFQCVELAQRYFATQFGQPTHWNVAYASQMCSSHPPGVKQTSSPNPGDLIVLSTGQYGHVAVITGVSGSKVQVIEQNSSPSGQNAYSFSQAACFLTH